MQTTTDELHQDPATLFAIAVAAHQAKNRDLERSAKRQLRAKFGVRITFERQRDEPTDRTEAP